MAPDPTKPLTQQATTDQTPPIRRVKQLNPNLDLGHPLARASLTSFLQTIASTKELKPGEEIYPPTLAQQQSERLTYSHSLKEAYPSQQFYLLPADVLSLVFNIYQAIINSDQLTLAAGSSQFAALIQAINTYGLNSRNPQINLQQEQEIINKFFQDERSELSLWSNLLQQSLSPKPEQEVELEEQEPAADQSPPPTASVPGSVAKKPKPEEQELPSPPETPPADTHPTSLLPEDLSKAAAAYAQLAISATLTYYTSDEANGLAGLSFDQLPTDIKQALTTNTLLQAESFLESLAPDELKTLVENGDGAVLVRAKLAKQLQQYLLTSVETRIILQTAVDYHYSKLNPDKQKVLADKLSQTQFASQTTAKDTQEKGFEQEYSQLEKPEWLNKLPEIDIQSFSALQNPDQALVEQFTKIGVESASANLAMARFKSVVNEYLATQPVLSPTFIRYLPTPYLANLLNLEPRVVEQKKASITQLLLEYWQIKRAKHLRDHPQLRDADYFPEGSPQQKIKQTEQGRQAAKQYFNYAKEKGIDEERALSLLRDDKGKEGQDQPNQAETTLIEQFKQDFWRNWSLEQKENYLKQIEGLEFERQRELKQYLREQEDQLLTELSILDAMTAQHQAAQNQVRLQLAAQLQAQAFNQELAQLEAVNQLQTAAILQANQFLTPGQTLEGGGSYQPNTGAVSFIADRLGAGQLLGNIAQEKGGGLFDKLLGEGLNQAVNAAGAAVGVPVGALDKIPVIGALKKQLVTALGKKLIKENLEKLAKIAGAVVAGLGALVTGLIRLAGTSLGIGAGGALIGGIIGGPVGAGVGFAVGTGGGLLAQTGGLGLADKLGLGGQGAQAAAASRAPGLASQASAAQQTTAAATTQGIFQNPLVGGAVTTGAAATTAVMLVTTIQRSAFLTDVPFSPDPAIEAEVSPYVDLDKSANPTNIENNQLADIDYTITITPKDNYIITPNLEKITDQFTYLGGDPLSLTSPIEKIKEQIGSEPITEPKTITYTIEGVSGVDVMVVNSLHFAFSAQDSETGEIFTDEINTVGSLIIGQPELGCFEFGPSGTTLSTSFDSATSISWTAEDKNRVLQSFAQRAGKSPMFTALLCADGPITVYRLGGSRFGGWAVSSSQIGLYDAAFKSEPTLEYTFVHELGHLTDYRNPGKRAGLMSVNTNTHCFTYPFQDICATENNFASETFAEGVALYVVHSTLHFSAYNSQLYNFPQRDPVEYNWYKENIFGGVEY